jgi:hypothetical protein
MHQDVESAKNAGEPIFVELQKLQLGVCQEYVNDFIKEGLL